MNSTQEDALFVFNSIKDFYASKIDCLNDLKKLVFSDKSLDTQLRAKLRITIESLLIDLNEEVFAISEELAKSFTFEKNKNQLGLKAKEFEHRRAKIARRIEETIDQNQSIKTLRRGQRIQGQSPPQRDLNTFGPDESIHYKQSFNNTQKGRSPSPEPTSHQQKRRIQHNSSSKRLNQGLDNNNSNSRQRVQNQWNPVELFNTDSQQVQSATNKSYVSKHQKNSLKKKKSPVPLRRRADDSSSFIEGQVIQMKPTSQSSRQANSAKKQLFRTDSQNGSRKNLSKNDNKHVKKSSKRLEEFEKFLANKTNPRELSNKENKQPDFQQNTNAYSTITLQSEAFELFTQDFAHVKNKLIQMQSQMTNNNDRVIHLEEQVNKLKAENIKLTTDVKIIRNEHSEILHSLFNMEKKNSQLQQENQTLKKIVTGERELKGQESNLPKQIITEETISQNDITVQSMQNMQDQRKTSPFSSFLNRNRSFSLQKDQKDHQTAYEQQAVSGSALRNFREPRQSYDGNTQRNEGEYMSFYPQNTNPSQNQNQALNHSLERELTQLSGIHKSPQQNIRSSLQNCTTTQINPMLTYQQDRHTPQMLNQNPSQSFISQQPPVPLRQGSGSQSRGSDNIRQQSFTNIRKQGLNETPSRILNITNVDRDDTPNRSRDEGRITQMNSFLNNTGNLEKNRSLINANKMTPTSQSNQKFAFDTSQNPGLSDWVLERLRKQ